MALQNNRFNEPEAELSLLSRFAPPNNISVAESGPSRYRIQFLIVGKVDGISFHVLSDYVVNFACRINLDFFTRYFG